MAKTKKTKKPTSEYKIISIKKLSDASRVEYMQIYNTLVGNYNGLTRNQKTILCNTLYIELKPMFEFLGFEMKLKRLPEEQKAA